MKKFFSLVLALVMALSLTTMAWGAAMTAAELTTAITSTAVGGTLELDNDVEADAIILIDKSMTLDGKGQKLTSSAARGINIKVTDGAEVIIKNLTVVTTNASAERGINFYTEPAGSATLKLDNVTVSGTATYAVNLPGGASNSTVEITNSDLTGMIALNVWGSNMTINVVDSVLSSVEDDDAFAYSAIQLNNNTTDSADGTVVNVTGGAVNGNGSPAQSISNWTTTGTVNISGTTSVSGDMVQIVAIIDGAGYTSVAEATEEATAGKTIIVLPAASAQGAFTPKAGVTYKDTTGATLAPAADGKITPPAAGFVNNGKYDLYDANGNLVAVDVTADEFDAALTKTGGNVEYYELTVNGITQKYYVEVSKADKADAEFYLTLSGNTGAIMYLEKVPFVAYTNAKVMNNIGTACDQLNVNKKYDYYYTTDLDTDVKTYYKGVTDAAATEALMVGGELVQVAPVGFGVNAHVWQIEAINSDHEVTAISCKVCGAVYNVYENKLAAPAGAILDPVYGYIAPVAPTASTTPSTDKVQSAETFDAGIAMYVGMSVMAAAGSAVVIGKKKD